MAGDWIKMRIDLQSHPKVVRILSATLADKFRVIGGLHAVWSVFDTHSEDGILPGYTLSALDHVIGWDGFSAAMVSVGWLEEVGDSALQMPEFTEHNGKSAKRRAEDQKRKRDARTCPQSVRNLSANDEDKKRTREEKRREDKGNNKGDEYAADFCLFWESWPEGFGSKGSKQSAFAEWRKAKPDAETLIRAVTAQAAEKAMKRRNGDFSENFKHVCRWLKGREWENEVTQVTRRAAV